MDPLLALAGAALVFAGTHFLIPPGRVRPWAVTRFGEPAYRGAFSAVALASLVWLVLAYRNADWIALWGRGPATRWLAIAVMPIALTLLAGSLTPSNPTSASPAAGRFDPLHPGIFALTRHPMMWGIGLWGVVHVLANGDVASVILFGTLTGVALGGTFVIDARKSRSEPERWAVLGAVTSNLPLLAVAQGRTAIDWRGLIRPAAIGVGLWVALLHAHQWLFGLSVLH